MGLYVLTSDDSNPKRTVGKFTPRGRAECEICGKELDYDYGSIAWECRARDLCIEHWISERDISERDPAE